MLLSLVQPNAETSSLLLDTEHPVGLSLPVTEAITKDTPNDSDSANLVPVSTALSDSADRSAEITKDTLISVETKETLTTKLLPTEVQVPEIHPVAASFSEVKLKANATEADLKDPPRTSISATSKDVNELVRAGSSSNSQEPSSVSSESRALSGDTATNSLLFETVKVAQKFEKSSSGHFINEEETIEVPLVREQALLQTCNL